MTIFYHDINFDIQLMCRCYLRNETLKNALFSCTYNSTGCNKGIFDIIKKRAFFYVCILGIKVLIDTPNFYVDVNFVKKCTKFMKLVPNLKLPKIVINGITTRILQYWWKIVLENFSDGTAAIAFHALYALLTYPYVGKCGPPSSGVMPSLLLAEQLRSISGEGSAESKP